MRFDPQLAEIRFGCGLSPTVAPPSSIDAMLAALHGPDTIAERFPIETFESFQGRIHNYQVFQGVRRGDRGSVGALAAKKANKILNKEARIAQAEWFGQHLNRWVATDAPCANVSPCSGPITLPQLARLGSTDVRRHPISKAPFAPILAASSRICCKQPSCIR